MRKLCIGLHMCTMTKGQLKIVEIIKKTREEVPSRHAREFSRTKVFWSKSQKHKIV